MISQTIARRYAQALLALGQEDGHLDEYRNELAAFTELVASAELMEALTNPIYPQEIRRKVLDALLDRMGLSKLVRNFLGLLQDKGRIGHIEAIDYHFRQFVDEANNIKRAIITAAGSIDETVRGQIQATLEEMTGKTILLETRVDPEIIGGIVARVGDLTLDGSVKTQLKNLKESLIKG